MVGGLERQELANVQTVAVRQEVNERRNYCRPCKQVMFSVVILEHPLAHWRSLCDRVLPRTALDKRRLTEWSYHNTLWV